MKHDRSKLRDIFYPGDVLRADFSGLRLNKHVILLEDIPELSHEELVERRNEILDMLYSGTLALSQAVPLLTVVDAQMDRVEEEGN
jgi:predicted ATPase